MPKKIIFILMVFFMVQFLSLSKVRADSKGKVVLMPFTIHSQVNLAYLQKNILESLFDGLSKQSIPVLPLSQTGTLADQNGPDGLERTSNHRDTNGSGIYHLRQFD